jgi:hypothetical protein
MLHMYMNLSYMKQSIIDWKDLKCLHLLGLRGKAGYWMSRLDICSPLHCKITTRYSLMMCLKGLNWGILTLSNCKKKFRDLCTILCRSATIACLQLFRSFLHPVLSEWLFLLCKKTQKSKALQLLSILFLVYFFIIFCRFFYFEWLTWYLLEYNVKFLGALTLICCWIFLKNIFIQCLVKNYLKPHF